MNHAGSIDVLGSSKMGPMGSRSFKNTVHHNLIFFLMVFIHEKRLVMTLNSFSEWVNILVELEKQEFD